MLAGSISRRARDPRPRVGAWGLGGSDAEGSGGGDSDGVGRPHVALELGLGVSSGVRRWPAASEGLEASEASLGSATSSYGATSMESPVYSVYRPLSL